MKAFLWLIPVISHGYHPLKTMSWIFPSPGVENPIYPPVLPNIFPGLAGGLPLGQADDMCIRPSLYAEAFI